MNCQELQRDIENFKEAKAALDERLETMSSSSKISPEFHDTQKQLDATENAILEKYIEDFAEHNPECSPYTTGEASRVGIIGVTNACAIDESHLLFGGAVGEMSIVEVQDDLSLKKTDAKVPDAVSGVYGLSAIDENTIIYGSRKTFNDPTEIVFLSKTTDGLAESNKISIDGLGDVMLSTALSSDRIIVGSGGGLTCVITRQPDGSIKHSSIAMPPLEVRGDEPERFVQIDDKTATYITRTGRVVVINHLDTDHPEPTLADWASSFVIPFGDGLFLSKDLLASGEVSVFTSTGHICSYSDSDLSFPYGIDDIIQLSNDTFVGRNSTTNETRIVRWNGSSFELGEQIDIPESISSMRTISGMSGGFFSSHTDGKEVVKLFARKKPSIETVKDSLGLIAKKRQNP